MRVVEAVTPENMAEVTSFLSRHEESSQFLINNLREHGPVVTEHHNSGNFKFIRDGGKIAAVFCLARRGNLFVQSEIDGPAAILDDVLSEPYPLRSFLGDWNSIDPVYRLFKEKMPSYSPSYVGKDILYSYNLTAVDKMIRHDSRVRLLMESDFPQWIEFNDAYQGELGLPNDLTEEQRRKSFESQVACKVWWGLFDGETLLSRTALNSKGEKIGQVGGVFTPIKFRQRGLAKATMFHMLKDCRDLHGHAKSILFTGETDIPAQKLYESMGYGRIGSFALILG